MASELELARKTMIRWRVLRILESGRPLPVGEGLVLRVLNDADLEATPSDVRKALQYLCDKTLIEVKQISRDGGTVWEARLLPDGVDFVEHNAPDIQGIARTKY